ncbi:DUF1643 domain-containing protein [Mycolicibacterium sp. 120270]|uniref:DUF1643 domain-containing protein n=1 Tax=Mycolicibacterium sp. 120270 TaxID=3090600 RepID=UPI00299F372D|nr:DUF1643 domain-containing protein [Mycolicibacterium sp. 120270]MDX1886896.1 DUF1643 domain-containing protein [Mycolicibacterium sp. 120270]
MTLTLDHRHPCPPAEFSPDRRYRYRLTRRWGDGPALMFISDRPSGADEHHDDPTVRLDKRLARRFGYDALTTLSLYAGQAADPADLAAMDDPIGPDNDSHLNRAAAEHDVIVFAWGDAAAPQRAREVATRLWRICRHTGGTVAVLGWTPVHQPCHLRDVAATAQLHCLTARAHLDLLDVDPRWPQLLTNTCGLDDTGPTAAHVVGAP